MNRIIINNQSALSDLDALNRVFNVIKQGRISNPKNPQYCYVTTFEDGITVIASRNQNSDSFKILQEHCR